MKVLVGDHSGVVRSRLVARLRESGLDVVGEGDSLKAITSLAAMVKPDAIVTDIKFDDGRGVVVVRAMRKSAPRALLVVLTNTLHFRLPCLTNGADFFLDKSSEFEEVAPTLTTFLDRASEIDNSSELEDVASTLARSPKLD